MDVKHICKQYELGQLLNAVPLNPGTEAQVWRMDTEKGSFLLRTLRGPEQGALEWKLFCHLSQGGFPHLAGILTTADGQPVTEQDGVWYQLQQLLPGDMPNPMIPGVPAAVARTLKNLARCMPDGMIHGDLGPWNMVRNEDGTISVIDFGAAREGDSYFDYAAAFGGVINHTPAEERARVCREFLNELDADRGRLLEQLRLWAEEGIAQWSGKSETMVARFHNALRWAKENLYEL